MKILSYFKSKIYLKIIIVLSVISFLFTISLSVFVVPKIDSAIEKLENKNVNLIFSNVMNMVNNEYKEIEKFKVLALNTHKNTLKNTTNVAWTVLNTKYDQYKLEKNKIKQQQIKNDALKLVENLRYKADGYFWINDFYPRMVMHPFNKSLNGKKLNQFKDPNGVFLFNDMITTVKKNNEGFVKYSWPKPNHEIPQLKISFVKSFPEWEWIIGTGIYIDDIEKEILQKQQDVIKKITENVKNLTIGKSGYVFIFHENGDILYHPDEIMINKNIKNIKNVEINESFYDYFTNLSQSKTKKSFYLWNKPDDKENYNYKILSWVNHLENAKIYICATVYEDEIKESSENIAMILKEYSFLKFFFILFFSLLFIGMTLRPIIRLSHLSKKVQNGDYYVRSDIKRDDEIGDLSNAFNCMLDEISSQINTLELRVNKQTLSLQENSEGLEKIIHSIAGLLQISSLSAFTRNVLSQLNIVLGVKESNSYFCTFRDGKILFLSSNGKFFDTTREVMITPKSFEYLNTAYKQGKGFFKEDIYVGFYKSHDDLIFLYLEGCDKLSKTQKHLLEIFSSTIAIAFDNLNLTKDIIDTQKELLLRLGEMVELKSKETAGHVQRVASISYILAIAYGIPKNDAYILKLASPMHDIGKLGIPESILKKPGKLDDDEFVIMKQHAQLGYDVFKNSEKQILRIASIIAHQHHEKWNGTGYPRGLQKTEIDIYARITTVADVFDALTQKRIYKEPWSTEKVLSFFDENSGIHFDPALVKLLHENIDKITKFREDNSKE